jgi:prepilin-type N-terminal cleavage/methylation domain-containing protein
MSGYGTNDCDADGVHARRGGGRARGRGFTLIEATACVVIVAIMLVAAVQAIGAAARARLLQQDLTRAQALARQLMGEIRQNRYRDPIADRGKLAAETGETSRSLYNDVDDYNNYKDQPPVARDGTALAGYTGWQRKVKVQWVDPNDPSSSVGSDTGLKKITVTVTTAGGKAVSLTALRSQYGMYDHQPAAQTTYVGWVGVTCRVGESSKPTVVSGASTANLVP